MSLAGPVVGILAQDQNLHRGVRGQVQGREHLVMGWKDVVAAPLRPHELLQFPPVGLVELTPQQRVPVGQAGRVPTMLARSMIRTSG